MSNPDVLPTPRPGGAGTARKVVALLVGLAVSVALLRWSFRGVALDEIGTHLRAADPLLLLLAVVVATSTFAIRAVRWHWLLLDDHGKPLPLPPLWHAVAIGFMGNNLLPFRAGELLRMFSITRLARVRFTSALASVAVERVFDGLTVVALIAVSLVASDISPSLTVGGVSVRRFSVGAAVLCVAILVAAIAVVAFPVTFEKLVRRLIPSQRLADRLVTLLEGIRHGFAVLRSPSRLTLTTLGSIVLWLVNAASFWIAFKAFHLPVGFAGALLMQGVLVFGVALPSTPGYVGVFEAAIVAVLALFAVEKDQALSYAIAYHITTFIPIIVLGFWSLSRTSLRLNELRRAEPA